MPTTIPSALLAHIEGDACTLAYGYKITYSNPVTGTTVIGLTTSPVEITIDGVLYLPENGVIPSTMTSALQMDGDRWEISGFFGSSVITEDNIIAGVYDYAEVVRYVFNWADASMGFYIDSRANVSDIHVDGRQWTMICSDILDLFDNHLCELTSSTCRAILFDSRCKVSSGVATWAATTAYTLTVEGDAVMGSWIKPTTQNRRWFKCTTAGTSGGTEPSWNTTIGATTSDESAAWKAINAFVLNGSVTSLTSNQAFSDSSITEANDFWTLGKIIWTSGANLGFSSDIKSQTGAVVELYVPTVRNIAVGDTFQIFAGCDRKKSTCKDKFSNIRNMRAEPDKPSAKILNKVGPR